jgi:hypothetical protein
MTQAVCAYCDQPVEPDNRDTWHRVTGWERPRRQGGTNHIALRKRTGHFACAHCMDALVEGRHPMQLELALGRR